MFRQRISIVGLRLSMNDCWIETTNQIEEKLNFFNVKIYEGGGRISGHDPF